MQQKEENIPILDNGGVQCSMNILLLGEKEYVPTYRRTQHDLTIAKASGGKKEFCGYYGGHKDCHIAVSYTQQQFESEVKRQST